MREIETQRPKGPKVDPKVPRERRVRQPRAQEVAPCLICAEPMVTSDPKGAVHRHCVVKAPRCRVCGGPGAMAHPECSACKGRGLLGESACPYCPPAACAPCVMKVIIERHREIRDRASSIGMCSFCEVIAVLVETLCSRCFVKMERDWELYQLVGS